MASQRSRRTSSASPKHSALTPARALALEVTSQVRVRQAYARELLDARRGSCELAPEEFAYGQVLSFGVVMCSGVLDLAIDRSLNKPSDIKPKVRDALRISAFELLFLKKPAHVVVSQGVELVRQVAKKAAGLANAVLRKMVADAAGFPWEAEGSLPALANETGLPLWLVQRLTEDLGAAAAASVMWACLKPAPTYVVEPVIPAAEAFPSDLAAQQVASLVPLEGVLLEVGAGRGTKTMLLQDRAQRELGRFANIHTLDLHPFKEELLRERLDAMGVEGVTTHSGDACKLHEVEDLPDSFDAVFVDAPCSGTGTLRRHPEIRWRLTSSDVTSLANLQLRMLKEVSSVLRPGGVLVYATCSVLKEENQQVVADFLASPQGAGFSVEPATAAFDAFEDAITPEGFFASLPVEDGPDGHFAVIMRRS